MVAVIFLISFLASPVVAADRDVNVVFETNSGDTFDASDKDVMKVDYGINNPQPFKAAIYCDGGDCPYGPHDSDLLKAPLYLRADGCGEKVVADNYITDSDFWTDKMKVPVGGGADLQCTPGLYDLSVVDGNGDTVKTLNTDLEVDYQTSGSMITVEMDPESSLEGGEKLHQFKIQYADSSSNKGHVNIKVAGTCIKQTQNCGGYYEGKTNVIMSPFTNQEGPKYTHQLEDIILTYWDSYGTVSPGYIANYDFQDMTSRCGGDCPASHVDDGTGADYIPRGEVVVGKKFNPDFEWGEGPVETDEKRFHICDSEMDGIEYMEGKTVWSPGSNFEENAFMCHDDEWIPRERCEPSETWEELPNGVWSCSQKDPIDIEAEFYDIKKLPYNELTSEFVTGFRIPSEEVEKFINYYDSDINEVQAECWMGDNNQRPESASDTGQVIANADDFRNIGPAGGGYTDIEVITEVPYRESVKNDTYSCVYGIKGYSDKAYKFVHEATNSIYGESADARSVEIEYSDLKSLHDIYSYTYSQGSRSDWVTEFGAFSNRENVDSGENNPFRDPNKEHPYCPNPPDWADIQCERGASFEYSKPYPQEIEFDASRSNFPSDERTIDSYSWDFGNGDTGEGEQITYFYENTGDYTVTLTVTADDGTTASTSKDIVVNSPTAETLQVAFLPARYDASNSDDIKAYNYAAKKATEALKEELPIHERKIENITVQPSECSLTCNISGENSDKCIDEVPECVGSGKPLQQDDYNLVHVLCNKFGGCEANGAVGIAYLGGTEASTLISTTALTAEHDMGLNRRDTVVHETGHNLDLRHLFNEEMLDDGWSFGDRYDPENENPTITGCGLPDQYDVDLTFSNEKKLEYWTDGGDFPNEADNFRGEQTQNYFLSYCNADTFGPNAIDHMEQESLSAYKE